MYTTSSWDREVNVRGRTQIGIRASRQKRVMIMMTRNERGLKKGADHEMLEGALEQRLPNRICDNARLDRISLSQSSIRKVLMLSKDSSTDDFIGTLPNSRET